MGNSGFRKISMTNPADSTRLNVPLARQFIVGEDNNLYLTTGKPELYVYPLDITDRGFKPSSLPTLATKAIFLSDNDAL